MKNPKERFILLALLLVILFASFATVIFSESAMSLSARSAALYEPRTKELVYSKNADERLPMASTTKIMTALVALESFPSDATVVVPSEAVGTEGSSLYLKCGESFVMKDLITAMMLRSANDAAVAIAYAVSGGVEAFSHLMNEKAASLGLTDTHFTNPHGLDSPEHYTTARELALIAAAALDNSSLKEISAMKKAVITNAAGESRLVVNHNKLLSLYDGAIGVKTGFTKKSGRSLVGAAERDGLMLISVTINAPDDWNDHRKLFDYGYSVLSLKHLANPGDLCYNIPVIGSDKNTVRVTNYDTLEAVVRRTESDPCVTVTLPRYVSAPVRAGDVIGKAVFTHNGIKLGEIELLAAEDADVPKKKGIFHFI